MSKKPKWRFRLTFRGRLLSGFVWIDIGDEMIIKPLIGKVRKHLSLYPSEGKLHRHVTHEEHQLGRRRHTQRATVSSERLINRIFRALGPADDPPPSITSFADKEQMEALTDWFGRIWPRLFRRTTDAAVCVVKGPLGELLDTFMTPLADNFHLDFEHVIDYYASVETEEDAYEMIKESDLRLEGRRVAFSEDWSKFIFLVTEDTILELDVERLETAMEENLRELGFEGFFRTLRRQGYTFVDGAVATEFREALPPSS